MWNLSNVSAWYTGFGPANYLTYIQILVCSEVCPGYLEDIRLKVTGRGETAPQTGIYCSFGPVTIKIIFRLVLTYNVYVRAPRYWREKSDIAIFL